MKEEIGLVTREQTNIFIPKTFNKWWKWTSIYYFRYLQHTGRIEKFIGPQIVIYTLYRHIYQRQFRWCADDYYCNTIIEGDQSGFLHLTPQNRARKPKEGLFLDPTEVMVARDGEHASSRGLTRVLLLAAETCTWRKAVSDRDLSSYHWCTDVTWAWKRTHQPRFTFTFV